MGDIHKYYFDKSQSHDVEVKTPMTIDEILALRQRMMMQSRQWADAEVVDVEEEKDLSSARSYPALTDEQKGFLADKVERRQSDGIHVDRIVVDKEDVYHKIYDMANDWQTNVKTNTRKWRLLYEVMKRKKLILVSGREKYAAFNKCVIGYVFGEEGIFKSNNLVQVALEGNMEKWTDEDRKMYRWIVGHLMV